MIVTLLFICGMGVTMPFVTPFSFESLRVPMYTRKLANVMRQAAQKLNAADYGEGVNDYEWTDTQRCNCGFLAQVAMGINSCELRESMHYKSGAWTDIVKTSEYCPQTGLALKEVFKVLKSLGFKKTDFRKLEYLNGDEEGDDYTPGYYHRDKNDVAKFLRAWANKIDKQIDRRNNTKRRKLIADVREQVKKPLPTIGGSMKKVAKSKTTKAASVIVR